MEDLCDPTLAIPLLELLQLLDELLEPFAALVARRRNQVGELDVRRNAHRLEERADALSDRKDVFDGLGDLTGLCSRLPTCGRVPRLLRWLRLLLADLLLAPSKVNKGFQRSDPVRTLMALQPRSSSPREPPRVDCDAPVSESTTDWRKRTYITDDGRPDATLGQNFGNGVVVHHLRFRGRWSCS